MKCADCPATPLIGRRCKACRDKHNARQRRRRGALRRWHCNYCGEAGHNVRTCRKAVGNEHRI